MKSVLVVDSSSNIRKILKYILIKNGYNVIAEASSNYEALEKAEFFKPDVITRDITIPVINNKELIENISKLYPDSNILILLEENKIFLI